MYCADRRIAMEGGEVVRAGDSSSSVSASTAAPKRGGRAPFSGLVICVSGLSKEARKQVMKSTVRLGGQYSPNLHPDCTHLLVQSLGGHKLEHAFKDGFTNNSLFVVSLGWFIDCVNKNVKLNELPYIVAIQMENHHPTSPPISFNQNLKEIGGLDQLYAPKSHFFDHSIYIDLDLSAELRSKVVDVATQEGAVLVDQWFVGCGASYVVCEGSSIQRYLGHSDNIVSPIWFLKFSKEKSMQRFVGLSADLARHVGVMLENLQHVAARMETWKENCHEHILKCNRSKQSHKERLQTANLAKCGTRNRRARRLQSCQVPLRPINPSSLLESICWSISEPTSKASVYADSLTSKNDFEIHKHGLSVGDHIKSEASFSNVLRPLTESEKNELVFKHHFLTILYPVDRFAELGPSSRTYFSETGFTCLQLLEFLYAFYQENMSDREIEVAIHTDSRHADQLRSIYCSERTEELGCMMYKRVEFLGSRKSFEMLKRVSGDNNSNVYELLIRE